MILFKSFFVPFSFGVANSTSKNKRSCNVVEKIRTF